MGNGFPDGYYHTCTHDASELTRWNREVKNSFLNRLKWSVKNPEEVNHEPIAVVNGEKGNKIISVYAKPGDPIVLDATKSTDPDGNRLTYNWFRYNDADSYDGSFDITEPTNPYQKLLVPNDLDDKNIHLILEVSDNGNPVLVSYRRFIIEGNTSK
jgi:hypothetical protein